MQNIHASLSLWAYIVFDDRAGKIQGLIAQWVLCQLIWNDNFQMETISKLNPAWYVTKLVESMNQGMNPSECSLSCVTPLITHTCAVLGKCSSFSLHVSAHFTHTLYTLCYFLRVCLIIDNNLKLDWTIIMILYRWKDIVLPYCQ